MYTKKLERLMSLSQTKLIDSEVNVGLISRGCSLPRSNTKVSPRIPWPIFVRQESHSSISIIQTSQP